MKKTRFTETKIVAILKEAEGGCQPKSNSRLGTSGNGCLAFARRKESRVPGTKHPVIGTQGSDKNHLPHFAEWRIRVNKICCQSVAGFSALLSRWQRIPEPRQYE